MQRIYLLSIISLFINVVGGFALRSKSVNEGDSVILKAGARDENDYDVIRWRFGNSSLVEVNIKTEIISTHDERFTDRLELDHESGDLTITNITSELSGLYEVNLISNRGTHTMHQTYEVTVNGVKSVSVMEGCSVTLNTNVQIQQHDYINWDFGPQGDLLSGTSGGSFDIYNERFRDRVHVHDQTGSLTITNITTQDSGLYQVELKKHKTRETIERRFFVTVSAQDRSSGVSSGVRSGSCVGVLLVFVWSQII